MNQMIPKQLRLGHCGAVARSGRHKIADRGKLPTAVAPEPTRRLVSPAATPEAAIVMLSDAHGRARSLRYAPRRPAAGELVRDSLRCGALLSCVGVGWYE